MKTLYLKIIAFVLISSGLRTGSMAAPMEAGASPKEPEPWVERCKRIGSEEICEAVQSLTDKQNGNEAIRIAFAKQKSSGRIGIMIKTPLGLRLDTGAFLRINHEVAGGIENIAFQRCFPDGCIAEKPLSSEEVERITTADALEIVILDLKGNPIIINLEIANLRSTIEQL